METTINRHEDTTVELTIPVAWTEIETMYTKVVEETVKETEISGFRKGKAPKALVEKSLERSKIYEEVIRRVIPQMYETAVKKHNLKPVIMPKIELKEAKEKKDWLVIALTAEKPILKIGDYKAKIRDVKTGKTKKIWLPGEKPDPENKEKENKLTLDEILKALYESIDATVSPLLIEQEANRLLADLIDQTRKLGMTIEQYLSARGKTADAVKADYSEQAKRTLVLEFALEEVADREGILVSDDDIDTVINTGKTEAEKESLKKERYYIASVLRRQKTLDFLASVS